MFAPSKTVLLSAVLVVSCTMLHVQESNGKILGSDMPKELLECIQLLSNKTGDASPTFDEDIYVHCLQLFLWKGNSIQWHDYNVTEKDRGYVNSLIKSFVRRSRRSPGVPSMPMPGMPMPGMPMPGMPMPGMPGPGMPNQVPATGFRIRQEYRRLTDGQRAAFHDALNQMKMSGEYDMFANWHQGIITNSAHGGPNFLGWHRVYLALFEEALRRINPDVVLPYWDSTLDFPLPNPARSIIWSPSFLGNGDGRVTTGPFANWMAAGGPLTRNIGAGSRLMPIEVIRAILTRCRVSDISFPTADPDFNLELHHGGPHIWVGGQMAGINTAAHDPIFFLHHAYIDYVWELFRIRQATVCEVNPSTDYPATMGLHTAARPMDRFPQYRNFDGYLSYWTQSWFRYESSPTCNGDEPFCGSPYLRCDLQLERCLSVERMEPSPVEMMAANGAAAFGGFGADVSNGLTPAEAMARTQSSQIDVGDLFVAPAPDPRTQDARMGTPMARKKRAINEAPERKANEKQNDTKSQTFERTFQAPSPKKQTFVYKNEIFVGGVISDHQQSKQVHVAESTGPAFLASDQAQLLPVPDYHETTISEMLKPPIQNSFIINRKSDISLWAFIPVKVIYTSHKANPVANFLQNKNRASPHSENRTTNNFEYEVPTARKCVQDESGAMQVRIQSSGLNYNGIYSDYALIDTHLPVDAATTYIGIRSPDVEQTEVILSAVHSCGLMCQAHCYVPGLVPSFKPCSGVLKISNKDPNVYGRTYEDAVSRVSEAIVSGGGVKNEYLRIVFDCSNVDPFPWE